MLILRQHLGSSKNFPTALALITYSQSPQEETFTSLFALFLESALKLENCSYFCRKGREKGQKQAALDVVKGLSSVSRAYSQDVLSQMAREGCRIYRRCTGGFGMQREKALATRKGNPEQNLLPLCPDG
jgi:hypothetical protein